MAKLKKKINGAWQTVSDTWPVHFSGDIPPATAASGTITLAADVMTTKEVQIATVEAIGFTPDYFMLISPTPPTSNDYILASYLTDRKRSLCYESDYNTYIDSSSTTAWATKTNGYLFRSGTDIKFAATASYKLKAGTWRWIAWK